ncbi:hypothetical protein [Terrilactibacillus laevilacticus]|uniref:Uncharacterized protein n=1 Tax=Terrilactibacillus laevilacticus TaxID=1380157 RepID=A0ABW5PTV9_9BACI|nr:hypothetical protein [Terrilactibacillus laevilacticus]
MNALDKHAVTEVKLKLLSIFIAIEADEKLHQVELIRELKSIIKLVDDMDQPLY